MLLTIEKLLDTSAIGKITRRGLKAAIVGAPNTGKSSLMNLLLNEDRVIVSDIAGTTRDVVEDEVNVRGITVRLLDTAGIRDSTVDIIEGKGIERTKKAIEDSDLRIFLLDASRQLDKTDEDIHQLVCGKNTFYVLNKIDGNMVINEKIVLERFNKQVIPFSTIQKTGMDKLEEAIAGFYYSFGYNPETDILVTNARQENLLQNVKTGLLKTIQAVRNGLSDDIIALELRKAKLSTEGITGKSHDDAVLDRIFSQFCIGK